MRIARTLWLSKDLDREVTMYALELIGVADADGRILSTDFRAWLEAQGQRQESD
jgi:primosomal protein N'